MEPAEVYVTIHSSDSPSWVSKSDSTENRIRDLRVGHRLSSGEFSFDSLTVPTWGLERRLVSKLMAQLPFAACRHYYWVLRILRLFGPDHCRGLIPISEVYEPVMSDLLLPASLETVKSHRVLTLGPA